MLQAIWDFLNGKKTYLLSLLGSVMGVVIALGYLSPQQSDDVRQAVGAVYDSLVAFLGTLMTLISLLAATIRHGISKNDPPAEEVTGPRLYGQKP